jgi:hypothetical protein
MLFSIIVIFVFEPELSGPGRSRGVTTGEDKMQFYTEKE